MTWWARCLAQSKGSETDVVVINVERDDVSDRNNIVFEAKYNVKQLVEGLPQLITLTVISSFTEHTLYPELKFGASSNNGPFVCMIVAMMYFWWATNYSGLNLVMGMIQNW